LVDHRRFPQLHQHAQKRVAEAYHNKERWPRMSITNFASSGKFSTDRTITEYNNEIWKLTPVKIGTNAL